MILLGDRNPCPQTETHGGILWRCLYIKGHDCPCTFASTGVAR